MGQWAQAMPAAGRIQKFLVVRDEWPGEGGGARIAGMRRGLAGMCDARACSGPNKKAGVAYLNRQHVGSKTSSGIATEIEKSSLTQARWS